MKKILNKKLNIHVKVKDKRRSINIGLIILVSISSILIWELIHFTVSELTDMDLLFNNISNKNIHKNIK